MAHSTDDDLRRAVEACMDPKSDRDLVAKLQKALKVARRLPKPPPKDTPLNIAARKRLQLMRERDKARG